jgi:hypothetical protein
MRLACRHSLAPARCKRLERLSTFDHHSCGHDSTVLQSVAELAAEAATPRVYMTINCNMCVHEGRSGGCGWDGGAALTRHGHTVVISAADAADGTRAAIIIKRRPPAKERDLRRNDSRSHVTEAETASIASSPRKNFPVGSQGHRVTLPARNLGYFQSRERAALHPVGT